MPGEEKTTTQLNVPIPTSLYRRLKGRAALDGLEMKQLAPLVLEKGLDAYESTGNKGGESGSEPGFALVAENRKNHYDAQKR